MTNLRILCSVALIVCGSVAQAQPLNRYPMFGVFGGLSMPLDFSPAGRSVAQNVPSVPVGISMSIPIAKPILRQEIELMLKLGLINTNVRYTAHQVGKPAAEYESTLINSLVLAQGNMLARVFKMGSFYKGLGQVELKCGLGLVLSPLQLDQSLSCHTIDAPSSDCPREAPYVYFRYVNVNSFPLDPAALLMIGAIRTTKKDYVQFRYGVTVDAFPFTPQKYDVIIRHAENPFDGTVRLNRSSAQLFLQMHISQKGLKAWKEKQQQNFQYERP